MTLAGCGSEGSGVVRSASMGVLDSKRHAPCHRSTHMFVLMQSSGIRLVRRASVYKGASPSTASSWPTHCSFKFGQQRHLWRETCNPKSLRFGKGFRFSYLA